MEFKSSQRKNAIEIIPGGKLDIDQAEEFETELTRKIGGSSEMVVGINLAKIEYIDSSGLGALIKVLNFSKNTGKNLLLFGALPKIQSIFTVARLEKFFTFTTLTEFTEKYPKTEEEQKS